MNIDDRATLDTKAESALFPILQPMYDFSFTLKTYANLFNEFQNNRFLQRNGLIFWY